MTSQNFTIIDGQRVQVQPFRKNKYGEKDGLEPSYGYYKNVLTPWGAIEKCYVVTLPSLAGGKESYASVYKPESNPGVRFSVFKIND
jgi:hypothetical protein